MISMPIAFIALGSNLGDRMQNIQGAIGKISKKCKILKKSSVYETEPMYVKEQPMFLNAVIKIETDMEPFELLKFLQTIEKKLGRNREKEKRFGARIIDLDILTCANKNHNAEKTQYIKLKKENLILPHPRMLERAFVLIPLYEICKEKWVKDTLDKLSEKDRGMVKKI